MDEQTAKRIESIKARLAAATKGPWFLVDHPWRLRDAPSYVVAGNEDPHAGKPVLMPVEHDEFTEDFTEEQAIQQADDDLDFAAHARSDVPWLLERLAEEHARAERLAEALATMGAV